MNNFQYQYHYHFKKDIISIILSSYMNNNRRNSSHNDDEDLSYHIKHLPDDYPMSVESGIDTTVIIITLWYPLVNVQRLLNMTIEIVALPIKDVIFHTVFILVAF